MSKQEAEWILKKKEYESIESSAKIDLQSGIDAIDHPDYQNYDIKVGLFSESLFKSNTFDVIYSSHFIEHLPDPVNFLKTSRQLLKDNGCCIVACPNIVKSFENLNFNAFTPDHLNYFSKNSLEKIAVNLGFELIDSYQYLDHGMYLVFRKIYVM